MVRLCGGSLLSLSFTFSAIPQFYNGDKAGEFQCGRQQMLSPSILPASRRPFLGRHPRPGLLLQWSRSPNWSVIGLHSHDSF